jgi:hypothetical protein
MKQLENSTETYKVYLQMIDMHSSSYSADVKAIFDFFPCSPQLWIIDVGYGLWNSLSKVL